MPTSRMPIISSDVATGRRMNGVEMLMASLYPGLGGTLLTRGRVDTHPRLQLVLPVDHDTLAGRQTFRNDRDPVTHLGQLDRPHLDGIVGLDDIRVGAVGAALDDRR